MPTDADRGHTGKKKFSSRQQAKAFNAKRHNKNVHPYLCDTCGYWHVGHLPIDVRYGAAGRSQYQKLPAGTEHLTVTCDSEAYDVAKDALHTIGQTEVTTRIAAKIGYYIRTENRSPNITEAADFPDSYWEQTGANQNGTNWRHHITIATMLILAKNGYLTLANDGSEVRIGHRYHRYLAAA